MLLELSNDGCECSLMGQWHLATKLWSCPQLNGYFYSKLDQIGHNGHWTLYHSLFIYFARERPTIWSNLWWYDCRAPFCVDRASFFVPLQPFLAVPVGQMIECRFFDTSALASFWNRNLWPSLFTVNEYDGGRCGGKDGAGELQPQGALWCHTTPQVLFRVKFAPLTFNKLVIAWSVALRFTFSFRQYSK